MSLTADLHCEIREVGGYWWPIATFDIGSARRFRLALQGAGLADRGLPPDVSDVLRDRYDEQVTAHPREIGGATFITTMDFIRAWHAFAQAHEANERAARLVVWFGI